MPTGQKLRLVGLQEVTSLLGGVSRQRADKITRRRGFPEPLATLERGRVWDRDEVDAWIAANRPPAVDEE
jgi:prophage regulatory protein